MLKIDKLLEFNHWWKEGNIDGRFVPQFKRDIFEELIKYLNLKQMIGLVGLRRTGKTTLFYQVIDYLIKKRVNPKNILFFSFDEKIEDIDEIIADYQNEIIKKKINAEKTFIFLDEIQKLNDWENKIKIIYDLNPGIKIFVSGSSSLNLLIGGKETLAGRIFYFNTGPLSFKEFLKLKDKKMESNTIWKNEIKIEINNYLLRAFPEIVNEDEQLSKKYIKEAIIEKIIFSDLINLYEIRELDLINKIIESIADNPGCVINLEDMSKDFGRSRQVISNYLFYLESCFLIKSLKNFKGSLRVSSRKLKKYYLIHPSLSLALSNPDIGNVIENLVVFETNGKLYWREGKNEVDIILKDKKKKIKPIEVKYKETIKNEDINGLINFMKRFKVDEGEVISKDKSGEETFDGKKIIFKPLWKFLLEESIYSDL